MPNVSHENHLIFMRMTVQVTYIFIPIVSLKDSFCHSGKSKLGIGLFIHELLREPLIMRWKGDSGIWGRGHAKKMAFERGGIQKIRENGGSSDTLVKL